MPPTLYVFSSGSLAHSLIARRDEDEPPFKSTPVEAVVVPVALLILLLTGAAIASIYSHWRRRNDRDRLIKASTAKASRKFVPDWLGNWLGSASATPLNAPSQNSKPGARTIGQDSQGNLSKPGTTGLADENSDVIALRPVSVYLPPHPLAAYDPYDRYDRYPAVRPKPIGVALG